MAGSARHGKFGLLVALALAICTSPLFATPEDELIGLWGHSTTFGPMLQGELTIEMSGERVGEPWRASFGGLVATVEASGDERVAVFPEGIGRFRGKLVDGGRAIESFWLRRGITEDPRYPGGSSQPFSTPLVLTRAGASKWTGTVLPLKDRFRLYLKIFRNEEGMLLGAFRDPYMNKSVAPPASS